MQYEFRGFGIARAVYTLTPESFSVHLPGLQLGKCLHEAEIPVGAITGFYTRAPLRLAGGLKGAATDALNDVARVNQGELWLGWTVNGKRKCKAFQMVDAADSGFTSLVTELARLRPNADLRALPPNEAKRRLGMMSDKMMALFFSVGVFVLIGLLLAGSWLMQRVS